MSDQELDYTTTPCGKCGLAPKELGGMVACDHCNNWYDYACAGVTDTVKRKKKWFCDNAVCVAAAKKRTKKDANPQSTADESDAGSVKSSTVPSADEQIKAMEEEQRRLEADWDKQMLVKEKQLEFQAAMKKKKFLQEQALRRKQMQLEEEWRCFELAELERENQLQLQVKHEHLKRVQKLEKDFREQMSTVDNQLDTMKMERQQKHSRPITVKNQSTPLLAPAGKTGICVESEMDDTEESSSSEEETDNEPDEKVKQGSRPTKGQLAARHGIGKHLPLFSGKPDDWPLFYAAYNSSTKACGFSDVDNLARLQQCLRGDALELVRGQLLLPKSVPRVIEKLRQHFGRPEQLLDRLLERVKELPAPKNLKGFIPFANVVEQLCDHVEAADLKEHLKNPLLIQGLIKKLPDAEKRQWADIKRAREGRKISLRTVTDFLLRIADDAREAEVDIERTTETRFSGEHFGRKRKEKGAVFSHAEEGNSNTVVSHRLGLKPCKVCQRTDHRLRFCQDFKNWSHAERVAMVTRDKLCKLCLGEHGGQCRFKFRCNVGSCKEAHNPLIHPVSAVGISAHIHSCNPLLFRIIPIQLHGRDRTLTVLAFLDEGASVTLIEGKLANRLGIVGAEEKLTIKWTADYSRTEKNSRKMNVWASAVGVGDKMLLRTVRTVGKLMLPHQKLDAAVLSARYQYMSDLPIASYEGQPELLIGLNNVHAFAPMEVKIGTVADPIAVRCKLGWTVYGPNQASHTTERGYVCLHHDVTNEDIHGLLKSHYALEESVVATAQESAEDKKAMEIMERTTKRIGERFQTGLLWKENNQRFPESIQMALRRNLQLERKLMKNPELYTKVRMQTDEDARRVVLFHEFIKMEAISRWNRLLRVTATVLRFIGNCKRKQKGLPILTAKATMNQQLMLKTAHPAVQTPLQKNELLEAEKVLWKQAQWNSFPDEMSVLTSNLQLALGQKAERIPKRSGLYKYSPTLDEDGVLRVDGRLVNAEAMSFNQRYPVILSRFHTVTNKIIQYYHEQFGHANTETVFNEIRKKFVIPNLRAAVSKVAGECVWCKVHRCVPHTSRMAPLPAQSVTPGKRPFNSVGVDYLGPVKVTVGRRKEKRYGKPEEIFSDNATCFRGAWNEMVKAKLQINRKCAEEFISSTTAWCFNPPGTPHMGGVWERMVRSVKESMKALDDGRKLTDEILKTTVAEAADMINTRPLTYKPQEPAGEEALTPNHFLRGAVTSADLQVEPVSAAEALRNVYKRAQYLSDRMWERWITEYLPTINKRSKWFDDKRQLNVGDLVFLVDGKIRKNWRRGKIVEVFPGTDGTIRQVSVRTADGKLHRRGAVNIAVMEIVEGKSGTRSNAGCYGPGSVTATEPASGASLGRW
ncbi:uncharacterized protein LOC131685286 [Topomyia yanbarensis]|uniref:uncharacterized protein LOC131685286 n=1 Tax=Topomyia yanbarensis TaxID=2498891 RepID=UPI00273C29ED|nr:uncharacterized protein LOC131685286 [Topomyia yanbarensis]